MDVATEHGFRRAPFWACVLVVLVAGQGYVTLHLFGPGLSLDPLTNEQMLVSGKHPLHAYHGLLTNRVWHERQATTCYDPAFQAGYLKTPIFDAGSRPAELFYFVGGPTAGAYKTGVALICLVAPLAFALAARGAGLSAPGACLAAALGGGLLWSPAGHALFEAGDIDIVAGGLFGGVYLTWLGRFWRSPGPFEWLVLTCSAAVTWYMQPLLMTGLLALTVLLHLWACRAVTVAWHLGLVLANALALGINAYWLVDWVRYIGCYSPTTSSETGSVNWRAALAHWEWLLPVDPVEQGVLVIAAVGLLFMARRQSAAALLLVLGAAGCVALVGAARWWPPLAELGGPRSLCVAVWLAIVPAAYLLTAIANSIGSTSGLRSLGAAWVLVAMVGIVYGLDLPQRWYFNHMEVGISNEREEIVQGIRSKSTPDGRIVWEDVAEERHGGGWTALLPELTQRHFIGGLALEAPTDHLQVRLANGKLLERALNDWSDDELARFFERYNVTRLIAQTPATKERMRRYAPATPIAEFADGALVMYALDRRPDFILKGRGIVTQMDWKRVALSDLEPDEAGVVVLSLHHHAGWRVTPGYIEVEKDVSATEPASLLRLRLPGRVDRVTLTWHGN